MRKQNMMRAVALACIVCLGLGEWAMAGIAMGITSGTSAPMGATTNHGWRFTAEQSIVLTDLGLWDDDGDGMDINHPIGLWEFSTGTLLTSGVISAGTGDLFIDGYRYVDVPDVTLMPGIDYVLGFATPSANDDKMIYAGPLVGWWVDPAITYVEARYGPGDGSLAMPGPSHTTTYYRFGPNFRYVPEPSTVCLLLAGGLMAIRRRR